MQFSLIVKSATQIVGAEILKFEPRKPAEADANDNATVNSGSMLGVKIADAALIGKFKPGQVVTVTIE